jgi:uncharacterized protein YyaL (SSP411 family)
MCISAYLEASKVLRLEEAEHFALRSLDRLLSEAWSNDGGLKHVIAYSDPNAQHRDVGGLLDDYAFTVIACLDAYEATSDISYYRFAERIAARMIDDFYDETGGGFFDTPQAVQDKLGALAARRKPLQDSPTPAGNPAAAVALLRLHAYSGDQRHRTVAEGTLEAFAEVAGHFGIFAATYGLAVNLYLRPHTNVVVTGRDASAEELVRAAVAQYSLNKSVLRLDADHAVAANLPPVLAETIPNLPAIKTRKSMAVLCSGFSCQPPVDDSEQLRLQLEESASAPAA